MNRFITDIKYRISNSFSLLPFPILLKIVRKELLLPLYHTVSDQRIAHTANIISYPGIRQFEKDLDFIQKYYSPVSLEDVILNIQGKKELPERAFLVTIDDGYREAFEIIAPILKRRSIPAAFFLNSSTLDNKEMLYRNLESLIVEHLTPDSDKNTRIRLAEILDLDNPGVSNLKSSILGIDYSGKQLLEEVAGILQIDIREYLAKEKPYITTEEVNSLIKDGFMIGGHSIDHPFFGNLPLEDQLSQALDSLHILGEKFSMPYNSFAFPHSDRGVSKEFYDLTHTNGKIDISFGTYGFRKGMCKNNLQRQPMELDGVHAKWIYKRLFSQEILKKIIS